MRAVKLIPLLIVVLLFTAAVALPNVKKSPPRDKAAVHAIVLRHVDAFVSPATQSGPVLIANHAIIDVELLTQTISLEMVEPHARDVAFARQNQMRTTSRINPDLPARSYPYLL
jgi:hypothetical protein